MSDPAVLRACTQAIVIGVFGGAGLVLTRLYSRRGPLIFPVYAALLAALAISVARFASLGFSARFAAVFSGLAVGTILLFVAAMFLGGRERRALVASGQTLARGGMPWWGPSLLLVILVSASAGAAYVSL
jgi:hypothetical protein